MNLSNIFNTIGNTIVNGIRYALSGGGITALALDVADGHGHGWDEATATAVEAVEQGLFHGLGWKSVVGVIAIAVGQALKGDTPSE